MLFKTFDLFFILVNRFGHKSIKILSCTKWMCIFTDFTENRINSLNSGARTDNILAHFTSKSIYTNPTKVIWVDCAKDELIYKSVQHCKFVSYWSPWLRPHPYQHNIKCKLSRFSSTWIEFNSPISWKLNLADTVADDWLF